MKRMLVLFLVIAVASSFGLAFATGGGNDNGGGKGGGTENPPPDDPPCDSDNHLVSLPKGLLDKCGDDDGDDDGHGKPPQDPPCDSDNHLNDLPKGLLDKCPGDDDDGDDDGDGNGGENLCTEAAGDPGLLTTDTLGQELWDAGLKLPPLTEDPERNGLLSKPLGTLFEGTGLEVVGDEAACALDLLLDEDVFPDL